MSFIQCLSILLVIATLSACGGGGGDKSSTSPVNIAPVANAGSDQSIDQNSIVTLSGAMSDDSDGNIVNYSWMQVSGATVTLSSNSIAEPTFTAPETLVPITLVFDLTVTDNEGKTASDLVSIRVNPVITAKVDDQTFTTTANSDGIYRLDIPELSAEFANELVVLEATGVGTQSLIKLVSIGLEVETLEGLTGADDILVADEYVGTNINHISTAIAARVDRLPGITIPKSLQVASIVIKTLYKN